VANVAERIVLIFPREKMGSYPSNSWNQGRVNLTLPFLFISFGNHLLPDHPPLHSRCNILKRNPYSVVKEERDGQEMAQANMEIYQHEVRSTFL
jgi:hypothetical protein